MKDSTTDTSENSLSNLHRISRVIADTASDAIITIDSQSTILFVNHAAEKIFGYSRDEMLLQSLTMLMPDYLRHMHRSGLKRYLATGERHFSWEAVELPGLHKIAQDYIRAGVHGTDLIQRVINSSGANPKVIRAFLEGCYPAEIQER